jgi:hypothetical protein
VEEEPWTEGDEVWSVVRAYFPRHIISDCALQRFYFGPDRLLRRHDYHVDIAGGFAAVQLTTHYTEANGIKLPTRRRAFTTGPARRPIAELLMVAIDISNVAYDPGLKASSHRGNLLEAGGAEEVLWRVVRDQAGTSLARNKAP